MDNFDALVFEDDPQLGKMIFSALSEICDSVILFERLRDLIDYRGTMKSCPGLLWMDLLAPGNDVDEAFAETKEIRERCPNSIVVVMTGVADPSIRQRAKLSGADAFTYKPIGIAPLDFARLIAIGAINAMQRGASNSPRILQNVCSMAVKAFQEKVQGGAVSLLG